MLVCEMCSTGLGPLIYSLLAEAVTRVFEVAAEYRQTFQKDVIIDLVGYRRHGHNELDQPAFTQPIMYQHIKKHPVAQQLYREKLVSEVRVIDRI